MCFLKRLYALLCIYIFCETNMHNAQNKSTVYASKHFADAFVDSNSRLYMVKVSLDVLLKDKILVTAQEQLELSPLFSSRRSYRGIQLATLLSPYAVT